MKKYGAMNSLRRGTWLGALMFAVAAHPAAAGLFDHYAIDVYKPDKVYPGTTIFGDQTNHSIVEVDMTGKVLWSYSVPASLGAARGMDVEWIPASDDILFTRETGVYEVNRDKRIVWSYKAPVSHDADRLPNGNTLMAWGWGADSTNPEAREVNPAGKVVWSWHAADHLGGETQILHKEGYTHTNSVIRLDNGDTLISLRNFYMLVEVNRSGDIVWKLPGLFTTPHDPEILANGNILVNTRNPQVIKEITPTGKVVWQYVPNQKDVEVVRYNHRLPNGNILFAERTKIIEITPEKEIVWQLRLTGVRDDLADKSLWLYKAERIPADKRAVVAHAYAAPSETLAKSGGVVLTQDQQMHVQARRMAHGMLARMDANGDGRISKAEFTGRAPFDTLDTNGDGYLTLEEAEAFHMNRLARMAAGAHSGEQRSSNAATRPGRNNR